MLSIGLTACTGPTSPVNNLKPVTKDASLKPSDQSGESSTLNDSAERQGNHCDKRKLCQQDTR